jgi:A/G-specific adenine glycosylase
MTSFGPSFAARVRAWQRRHGRHDLPWQGTRDPYRIWLSEVMLQQTQVATAIPYFERFVARFPDVAALAAAPDDEVMRLWSGLGYYARARNLRRAARIVAGAGDGHFPVTYEELVALPGVGPSTAAAIAVFATGRPHAILDGNVKRVMARHFGIAGAPDLPGTLAKLWNAARAALPRKGVEAYTQGLMDLGATVCLKTRPACTRCPVEGTCVALGEDRVAELPGHRATKAVPRQETAMLVVLSQGEVLLQKRPPKGIWGGLWSLPEAPAGADPSTWARQSLGLRVGKAEALEPFVHAFTHYRLAVKPWLLQATRPRVRREGDQSMWISLGEVGGAALPAPVKRLLAAVGRT